MWFKGIIEKRAVCKEAVPLSKQSHLSVRQVDGLLNSVIDSNIPIDFDVLLSEVTHFSEVIRCIGIASGKGKIEPFQSDIEKLLTTLVSNLDENSLVEIQEQFCRLKQKFTIYIKTDGENKQKKR